MLYRLRQLHNQYTKFAPQAFGAAEGVVELTRNVDGTGPFFSLRCL